MCAIHDVNFDVPRNFVPDLVILRAIDSVGDPSTKEGTNDARYLRKEEGSLAL